jgi:hypothetical protein
MNARPPAPRDRLHRWLAAGAIVVVAVSVSFASNAFKTHLKSTLPQPAPPEPVPDLPAETTPPDDPTPAVEVEPEPLPDPDDDAPPATDERIVPKGTAESSRAAAPAWATPGEWVPEHSRAADVFATVTPVYGELSKTFVVCRGRLDHASPTGLLLRLGALPELRGERARRGGWVYATAPLVDLRRSDHVELVLFKRVERGPEERLMVMDAFYGLTLARRDENGDIECGMLRDDDLQTRIARDAGRADAAIARLAATKLEPTWRAWGYPSRLRIDVERKISDVAAITGWDDVRVKKRVAAYARAVAKVDADKVRVFGQLHAGAKREATIGSVTIASPKMTCEPSRAAGPRCAIELTVTNGRPRAVNWNRGEDVAIAVATPAGPNENDWTGTRSDPGEAIVPFGETKTIVITGPIVPDDQPVVAQFRIGDDVGMIKVR